MPSYSFDQFIEEYELRLDKEFEHDGLTAKWSSGPDSQRSWGEEDDVIKMDDNDPVKGNVPSSAAALTADERYLAVSTNAVIRIYDVGSLTLCSELAEHDNNVWQLFFVNIGVSRSGYKLLSYGAEVSGRHGKIHIWDIGADGRLLTDPRPMPVIVEKVADDDVGAVIVEPENYQDQSRATAGATCNALEDGSRSREAHDQAKGSYTFSGRLPSFGTRPVSHDESTLIIISNDEIIHDEMRLPERLPQIVLIDIVTKREKCRLKGHKDAIMWVGWSLDDKTIATACWDETYRLWDAETGECKHVIGKTGGQNWAGAFLPDGRHILLSGGRPVKVGVYDIETALEVTRLETLHPTKLDHWMRYFSAHPTEDLIILQNASTLLAWGPFGLEPTPSANVQEIFALTRDEERIKQRFAAVFTLKWVDEGKKLIVQATDRTTFVWDIRQNCKWRFQRPRGWRVERPGDVFFVRRGGVAWVICLDGDNKVRFWKL